MIAKFPRSGRNDTWKNISQTRKFQHRALPLITVFFFLWTRLQWINTSKAYPDKRDLKLVFNAAMTYCRQPKKLSLQETGPGVVPFGSGPVTSMFNSYKPSSALSSFVRGLSATGSDGGVNL